MMQIRAAVGGGERTKALGPYMLAVPGGATIPRTGVGCGGIEVYHFTGAACIGIAILCIGFKIGVGGLIAVGIGHECFQRRLQGRRTLGRQGAIGVGTGVIRFCLRAEGSTGGATLAGVVAKGCGITVGNGSCNKCKYHSEYQKC